jgi:ATP-dependent exoDNAse (exonuclease V) beta subunit
VVTFTEAATAELRGRIRENIHQLRLACIRGMHRIATATANTGQPQLMNIFADTSAQFSGRGLGEALSSSAVGIGRRKCLQPSAVG